MQIKAVTGGVNVPVQQILANVQSAIRRQHPQVRPYQPQVAEVALVAGGPSLLHTIDELREAIFRGCRVCAVNGSYDWLIEHNFKPDMAVLLDARPDNAEFVRQSVPGCKYLLASQCAPAVFDVVEGRDVYVFHALSYDDEESPILDAYYNGRNRYAPVTGGSTVTIRALSLLRMLGFLRLDVFGFDSCWMGHVHHAYPQVLNNQDKRLVITVKVDGHDERQFHCAPWHLRQWEDFQMWVKERGHLCDLHVHGDGLIAWMMKRGAQLIREHEAEVVVGG